MAMIRWPNNTLRFSLLAGAIFHDGDEDHVAAFEKAVNEAKSEHVAPAFVLEPAIKKVEVNTDSFKAAAAGLYEYIRYISTCQCIYGYNPLWLTSVRLFPFHLLRPGPLPISIIAAIFVIFRR